MVTRWLVQDGVSGDVFVTDESTMSDALHYSEWREDDGPNPKKLLELYDFDLDPDEPFDPSRHWIYLR